MAARNGQKRALGPRGRLLAVTAIFGLVTLAHAAADAAATPGASWRDRPPQDEVIYFLLPDRFENGDPANDRGGLAGDRLKTGFDPADKGFYHGGDLKGLTARLDYIQGLGATAVWLAPVFRNKPVQGTPGRESAGYHGYWITDFTAVDPHFGSNADMKTFVDAAHARGLKVYMDIVVNHTADVIQYRECAPGHCPYRSRADYPYQRRGGPDGPAINAGFLGDAVETDGNFARLTDPSYAYTPYVPRGEEHAKTPDWLNDVRLYHNRGDSTFSGESSTMGDFAGLDDLMTENPRVVRGFIDIFGGWIDRYRIDGFRIDTAKHVNPEFWQAFAPAMVARARERSIPNFLIFGEVATEEADVALQAEHTRVDRLPTVLDFAFRRTVVDTVAGAAGPSAFARLFAADSLYEGGEAAALRLPTFISNHDLGRFADFARRANPAATDAELLKRDVLAHAMLMTLRGTPVIYYGDEQGFIGQGGDQGARQDMFGSQVASDNNDRLLGTTATTATPRFDADHPLYRALAELAALRRDHPALRRGRQLVRRADDRPGLLAVSRIDPSDGGEVVVVFNTSTKPVRGAVEIDARTTRLTSLHGACPRGPDAPGTLSVSLDALDYLICAGNPLP